MKKLVPMTNLEYKKYYEKTHELPDGIMPCPSCFNLENSYQGNCKGFLSQCVACWGLPAKKDGKIIMREVRDNE